jgi:hypothetical protein
VCVMKYMCSDRFQQKTTNRFTWLIDRNSKVGFLLDTQTFVRKENLDVQQVLRKKYLDFVNFYDADFDGVELRTCDLIGLFAIVS